MRTALLLLAAVGTAAGQIDLFDLATTGDGEAAYFATTLPRKGSGESVLSRIYQVDAQGVRLYAERPRIDPPPATDRSIRFTNYFNLSQPQVSRDGNVVALTGQRLCMGASACAVATTLQTAVTGLPGGTREVIGAGRLSGNGRYLLIYANGTPGGGSGYIVDLETGQELRSPGFPAGFGTLGKGRTITDDGTAVSSAGSLYLLRGGTVTQVQVGSGEAVIDAAARMVAYSNRRSIRIYDIAEARDRLLAIPGGSSYAPYLSADGRRVMFLSDASGLPQVYTVNTDGTGLRQVSRAAAGVLSAAMSDDGRMAWYFSGAARLFRMNLDTGDVQERLGRTPQPVLTGRMAAGSAYAIQGAGLSDEVFTVPSFPLPRSLGGVSVTVNGVDAPLLSVSPTQILLQVPWNTGSETSVEVKTESSSIFEPRLRLDNTTLTAYGTFVKLPQSPSAYGGLDALAVHQNWDALVTSDKPARPDEILHLYGTGFGRVDLQPPDGMPAPSDPPARTITPVTCWAWGADNLTRMDIPVLFAGLAPGLAGYYQLDLRLPAANLRPSVQLNCAGEGNSYDFLGSFAVQP